MMNKAYIYQKINEILIEEFEVDESVIRPDALFKESLDLDRLDYVDLVVIVESYFGVKLMETDIERATTFQDFYNIIENVIKQKI